MSVRKIVKIDEEKCDGCGLCVPSCAEGAIQIIDGKARLVNEVFCDGLGACLGECPQDAITIEEREADDFNEAAVEKHLASMKQHTNGPVAARENPPQLDEAACCPGAETEPEAIPSRRVAFSRPAAPACPGSAMRQFSHKASHSQPGHRSSVPSRLGHWPIQLMLVPPQAPFLKNADLIICADCVPFTVPDFHDRYLAGRVVLVGCPKLDDLNYYYEKFKEIFREAKPSALTVLRMEVPCCGGIVQAAVQARNETAPDMPVDIHTIGIQGGIRNESVPAGKAA